MRVGEILLEHRWVDASSLGRAIAEQRHTGKRLCSMLIARGLLDPDHASRALGEQHECAAVLQSHLERRDRSLVALLPAALARACFALPIGRASDGALIVCVRDPRPDVHAAIAQAILGQLVIAVAPATQLEHLVDLAYDPSPSDEYDVDLTTGPIQSIDVDLNTGPIEIGAMNLVGLDDARVTRDPSQSGQFGRERTPSLPPLSAAATIGDTIVQLERSTSRDHATDVAMRFLAGRWSAALLMFVKEGAVLGHRGHGAQLSPEVVHAVAIPLSAPSIVQVAHDGRRLATEPAGGGAIQDRLVRLLGNPSLAMAAPVEVAAHVACVIVVGDPLGAGDPKHDLERLVDALGAAYTRVVRDRP